MELDYEEGIELWKAGDSEAARDALRYALQGCGDNLWVHVALGRIALEDNDAKLARGHFGYAFELAQRALPPGFSGRLPRQRPANRPFFDAIEGLAACYNVLGKPAEAEPLRRLAADLSGERPRGDPRPVPGRRRVEAHASSSAGVAGAKPMSCETRRPPGTPFDGPAPTAPGWRSRFVSSFWVSARRSVEDAGSGRVARPRAARTRCGPTICQRPSPEGDGL